MKLVYKILIGVVICVGLFVALVISGFSQEMYIAVIIIASIIVTFLGLAYYDEIEEKRSAPPENK